MLSSLTSLLGFAALSCVLCSKLGDDIGVTWSSFINQKLIGIDGLRSRNATNKLDDLPVLRSTTSIKSTTAKMNKYLAGVTPTTKSNLVIYSVEDIAATADAIDLVINNVKIFIAAVLKHGLSSNQKAFYIFNVAAITDSPLSQLIPSFLPNVAVIDWVFSSSAMNSHVRTLGLLGSEALSGFSAVFCLGSGARGPLVDSADGQWLDVYRKLLDANNVGLVGPIINCEDKPHVQTHAFGIRVSLVPLMLREVENYYTRKSFVTMEDHFRTRLTDVVIAAKHSISSLVLYRRAQKAYFDGTCLNSTKTSITPYKFKHMYGRASSSVDWCMIHPKEAIFMRWSGEALNAKGFMCGKSVAMNPQVNAAVGEQVQQVMTNLASFDDKSQLQLAAAPEVSTGGKLHDLYRQYVIEDPDRAAAPVDVPPARPLSSSKACFLVRSAFMHDPSYHPQPKASFKLLRMDLDGFIKSLLIQTDPNWLAYFFITDPNPFDKKLMRILQGFNDPRLVYYDLDLKHRPKFTKVDAGYTTTDFVMRNLLQNTECKWISFSNGDNAYGSEIVERVRHTLPHRDSKAQANMVLAPLDSRNYADQDFIVRNDRTWDRRCVGIDAMLLLNQLAYTAQPLPKIARVDLAAIFFDREKLASENLFFSNFTDPTRFTCLGCNDGYFTQYLVRSRGWTYSRLPIDGLRSIVFHGPSPTLCIAQGNVWFDHPLENKVGCVSHITIAALYQRDKLKKEPQLDWDHFLSGGRTCLRLSKYGSFKQGSILKRRLMEAEDNWPNASKALLDKSSRYSLPVPINMKSAVTTTHQSSDCDWDIYISLNPELLYQNVTTDSEAANHYELYGRQENRPCQLDWTIYLELNPDLKEHGINSEALCITHYRTTGKKEGRRIYKVLPRGFDWKLYLELNPDLAGSGMSTEEAAYHHYTTVGKREGRLVRLDPNFDWRLYLELNPDLTAGGVTTEIAAVQHYIKAGRAEGRPTRKTVSPDFDWKMYLQLNPDLVANGVGTEMAAWQHYKSVGKQEGRHTIMPVPDVDNFDWMAYFELYPDLPKNGLSTELNAIVHYNNAGRAEGRQPFRVMPKSDSWKKALNKLSMFQESSDEIVDKKRKSNLVIYSVEDIAATADAIDLVINNVKIFIAAVLKHGLSSNQKAFYIFNVAAITDSPLSQLIPSFLPNVAVIDWVFSSSAMNSHVRTLGLLGSEALSGFSAVFCLGSGARGPLVDSADGQWLDAYRKLLDANNVGLVGPIINCEDKPHVQTHAFGIRVSLVPLMLREVDNYYTRKSFVTMEDHFRTRLTDVVIAAKHSISSLVLYRRAQKAYFDGTCLNSTKTSIAPYKDKSLTSGSVDWCMIHPKEAIFMRWSGEALNAKGFMCGKSVSMSPRVSAAVQEHVSEWTQSLASFGASSFAAKKMKAVIAKIKLKLPEALTGGTLDELYRDYESDAAVIGASDVPVAAASSVSSLWGLTTLSSSSAPKNNYRVCIAVDANTANHPFRKDDDISRSPREELFEDDDVEKLIKSLTRQSNADWNAFFYTNKRFSKEMKRSVQSFNDARLVIVDVDSIPKSESKVDGMSESTDAKDDMLQHLLRQTQCKWVSFASSGGSYGSEVVDRVLNAAPYRNSSSSSDQAAMLLAPIDSLSFADQDYIVRNDVAWDRRCVGIDAMLFLNQLAYTVQPLPDIQPVDLDAVFFDREKLLAENVEFGKFADPAKPACLGCNDGYFTQYLVRSRGWTYSRLPIDGLRSIVFHGPSPTLCIAQGNVWFDHPKKGMAGCLTHETLYRLYLRDLQGSSIELASLDWSSFHTGGRTCIRLSKLGYAKQV